MRRLTVFFLAFAPVAAMAGPLYKCVDAKGVTSYQQTPCASGVRQADRRYVAPVPDAPNQNWSSQAAQWNAQRPATSSGTIQHEEVSSGGSSNFAREEAERRRNNAGPPKEDPEARHRRLVERGRAEQRQRDAARTLQDQYGNQYDKPQGSNFATDRKTGKQCLINGQTIQC